MCRCSLAGQTRPRYSTSSFRTGFGAYFWHGVSYQTPRPPLLLKWAGEKLTGTKRTGPNDSYLWWSGYAGI